MFYLRNDILPLLSGCWGAKVGLGRTPESGNDSSNENGDDDNNDDNDDHIDDDARAPSAASSRPPCPRPSPRRTASGRPLTLTNCFRPTRK